MKPLCLTLAMLLLPMGALSETKTRNPPDPLKLLTLVSETYATPAETFHMESISESDSSNELHREWRKVYKSAIKGAGNRYRIQTRSPFGSFLLDSDGREEWLYVAEAKVYTSHPIPERWPGIPGFMVGGNDLGEAWNMREWLEADARGYKHATMLPEETITVEGKSYACYVVRVTSDDLRRPLASGGKWERTFWIDQAAHVFRKRVENADVFVMTSETVRIPEHIDTTTVYPVAEFGVQSTSEKFLFTPPSDAKRAASLDPVLPRVQPPAAPSMLGKQAPELTLAGIDGSQVPLSSYRGKPLLIDFWATWCAACLVSMPSIGKFAAEFQSSGLQVIAVDHDQIAANATEYLANHHYTWRNIHDADASIFHSFEGSVIPLTILLDAQGKIVYYDADGSEAGLRKAIESLVHASLSQP